MKQALLIAAILFPCATGLAQQTVSLSSASAAQETVYVKPATVAVYMGFTTDGGTDFTLGGEFTVRKPAWKAFGAGAFFSYIFSNNGDFILGATAHYFLPRNKFVLEAGPGWAFDGSDFLFRVGAGYEIARGALVIEPKTYFDFVYGTTLWGFGVAIGR